MSRIYIIALLITTVLVSTSAALFSVTGLVDLFQGSAVSVAIMAGSLELSKFVVVGFLYRYWGHIYSSLKVYLTFAVLSLMLITSLGIYGYLANSYHVSSIGLHTHLMGIKNLETENKRVLNQIQDLRNFIDQIPNSRISRKFEFQKEYEPKIRELNELSAKILTQIDAKKVELLSLNTKIGPAVYLAEAFGVELDTMVNWLILLFVLVFDPLAVSLVFCLNLIIRLREKYRGDEYKMGAHSMTSPVDHRLKKSA